jgi:hypothetical protein
LAIAQLYYHLGSATLVQEKLDKTVYVAKKILLGSLKDKEQESALNEVSFLFYQRDCILSDFM